MKLLPLVIALLALAGPVGLLVTQPGDDFGVEWDQRSASAHAIQAPPAPMRFASR